TSRSHIVTYVSSVCNALKMAQRSPRRVIAAQPMNTPTRRCGRRAKIDAAQRGSIGVHLQRWARPKLPPILHAAVDVAADIVGVVRGHVRGSMHTPRQDTLAKARGKALDLRLDGRAHIQCGSVG